LQDGTELKPVEATTVNSFELGYKTNSSNSKLFFDASAYYEISKDFVSSTALTEANPAILYGGRPLSELENIGTAADGVFST